MYRNNYGALETYPEWVSEIITELEERGAFETGIKKVGRRGGFHAVNTDCYDYCQTRKLAVIQVRECFKRKKWTRVRKNYFLVGRNENGNAFAHSVPSPRRSTRDGVDYALTRIWGCTEKQLEKVIRNGDVAFVPAGRPSDLEPIPFPVVLAGSHVVEGDLFFSPSRKELYADGRATIRHQKGQHPEAVILKGFFAVRGGYRAPAWTFSAETAD